MATHKAFYKDLSVIVDAETSLDASKKAAKLFKVKDHTLVAVVVLPTEKKSLLKSAEVPTFKFRIPTNE